MNAFALEFAAERLTEAGEASLCRGVGRIERRTDQRDARGDVDDHSVATRAQSGQRGARQQDRRDKIDVDHGLQLGFGRVLETPGPDAAGVVHEDVEAAERVDSLLDRCRAAVWRRYIGSDAPDGRAGLLKLFGPPSRERRVAGR